MGEASSKKNRFSVSDIEHTREEREKRKVTKYITVEETGTHVSL